jgi:hypothetical protein
MTIDLERLAVDADYWDEVAPEGATHFMYSEKFVKWVDGVEWAFYTSSDKAWKQATLTWPLQKYTDNGNEVIAKPKSQPTDTQAAESGAQISAEWVNGIPPVGWHGECTWGAKEAWPKCVILANGKIAIERYENWHFSSIADYREIEFRLIRSQAEREKAELIAEPEYDGTNLPPVGADQTVFVPFMAMSLRASANTESTWSVIAHHSGMVVVVINECGQGKLTVAILSEKECRPVVSQAERERKELATFLEDYHLEMGSYWCPEKEADYILSSYDVAKKARGES